MVKLVLTGKNTCAILAHSRSDVLRRGGLRRASAQVISSCRSHYWAPAARHALDERSREMPRGKKNVAAETAEAVIEVAKNGGNPAAAAPTRAIDPGRGVALERALSDITKRFGDGAIMRLGEATHM